MMKSNFKNITCIFFSCLFLAACEKKDDHVVIEYVDYFNYPGMGINKDNQLQQSYLVYGDEKQFCSVINSWVENRRWIYNNRFEKKTFNEIYLHFYKKEKELTPENPFVEGDFDYDANEYEITSFIISKGRTLQNGCEGTNPEPYYKNKK